MWSKLNAPFKATVTLRPWGRGVQVDLITLELNRAQVRLDLHSVGNRDDIY